MRARWPKLPGGFHLPKLPARLTDLAYDPKVRARAAQALLLVALLLLAYEIVTNTAANLKKQNIASGFGFLDRTAGFDVSQTLIDYNSKMSYARAFLVGLANTLLVAVLGIIAATVLGFAIGIARLSSNWLVARLALVYVEIVRNVPVLLQLLVWYVAVLRALPMPQQSLALGGRILFRRPRAASAAPRCPGRIRVGLSRHTRARRRRRSLVAPLGGEAAHRDRQAVPGLLVVARVDHAAAARSIHLGRRTPLLRLPRARPLQLHGRTHDRAGVHGAPRRLTVYTAAFIAEIVRSGISGVPRGQKEAAAALGLTRTQALRLVIVPQAMRIIIPPLTNQYLNLTKNSSLAVAIGYPDLVSVFAGTVLNQTGQAVEVILITMAVYLAISLTTALAMNVFNARMAIVER